MKKIVTIFVFVLSVMSLAKGATSYPYPDSDTRIVSVAYPLRTIILHPATAGNEVISAELVIEDGEYKLSYKGMNYAFRSISGSTYDSAVTINGQDYYFRVKPRSYE